MNRKQAKTKRKKALNTMLKNRWGRVLDMSWQRTTSDVSLLHRTTDEFNGNKLILEEFSSVYSGKPCAENVFEGDNVTTDTLQWNDLSGEVLEIIVLKCEKKNRSMRRRKICLLLSLVFR